MSKPKKESQTLEEACREYFPNIPVEECVRLVEMISYELEAEKMFKQPNIGDPLPEDDVPF